VTIATSTLEKIRLVEKQTACVAEACHQRIQSCKKPGKPVLILVDLPVQARRAPIEVIRCGRVSARLLAISPQ
jgi:hypothetical protein